MLYIVERVIYKEAQFGYYTKLVAYSLSKVVAHRLLVLAYILYYLLASFRREDTEICGADT